WCSCVPGDGQENLVEGGLPQGELGQGDVGGVESGQCASHQTGAVYAGRQGARVWALAHLDAELALEDEPGVLARCRVHHAHLERATADRCLQFARGAFGDDLTPVDHAYAVGELISFVEILGGQENCRAAGDHRAHDVPDLVAAARVQPGGRLVEEE